MRGTWQQWDAQTNDKVIDHIELSNLYLKVERGDVKLTIHIINQMSALIEKIYPQYGIRDDFKSLMNSNVRGYWEREIQKLPNFDNC